MPVLKQYTEFMGFRDEPAKKERLDSLAERTGYSTSQLLRLGVRLVLVLFETAQVEAEEQLDLVE